LLVFVVFRISIMNLVTLLFYLYCGIFGICCYMLAFGVILCIRVLVFCSISWYCFFFVF